MIDSIILQAEKAYGITLLGMLSMEYPKLNIILVNDLSERIAIPFSTLKKSRLISFSSSNIVPAKILGLLGYGAYNFHPGPPSRPGWGAIEKAIYD
jgi:methionyl-tRNA formyltransferase